MQKSLIKRRESIIVSTIQTLNEVGLQNLSTKMIANQEGVSEGTLFRHFKTKTDIMLAVVDHFSQYDDAIIETCIKKNFSPLEAIRYFYNAYAEYYQNYPEITVVIQAYDSLMCDAELAEKVSAIIYKRADFIIRTIQAAKDQNLIGAHLDPVLLENILTGGSKEICLKWRMERYRFSIKEKTAEMVETILSCFIKE
ncbi:TetR/AcrR family transcriptional regulator [Acetobacterium wieringae]|uniref:TetR/AcrR family transcriptional regulator n=1 Tax=Acetobacterium wieringae TaxID=52694 RepID=UPI0026EDF2E2|nr:TetR/AcrR family transcriptional regulator [Acetobacterium wieringae]